MPRPEHPGFLDNIVNFIQKVQPVASLIGNFAQTFVKGGLFAQNDPLKEEQISGEEARYTLQALSRMTQTGLTAFDQEWLPLRLKAAQWVNKMP